MEVGITHFFDASPVWKKPILPLPSGRRDVIATLTISADTGWSWWERRWLVFCTFVVVVAPEPWLPSLGG